MKARQNSEKIKFLFGARTSLGNGKKSKGPKISLLENYYVARGY
jgi:hypothetical protein